MAISFMQACREFFGVREGQRPLDFGKEVQALAPADRQEIAAGLVANGFDINPDTVVAAAVK